MQNTQAPLIRPLTHRLFGGVCAAFALHYGWSLTRVRIVTALLILCTGIGAFAYLAAWFVIPRGAYPSASKST
jgi:phage shock protein PspC (stress-responsive transcriptional regulator)